MVTKHESEAHLFRNRFLKAIFAMVIRVLERFWQKERSSQPIKDKNTRATAKPTTKTIPFLIEPAAKMEISKNAVRPGIVLANFRPY